MPRVNVTVTDEQHALLLELAKLQGGSAAGFLRKQLDMSTPFLRTAVPLMRRAAQEVELSKVKASKLLEEPLRALKELGLSDQLDLIDDTALAEEPTRRNAASGASEAGRRRGGRSGAGEKHG